jgi:hypothetical protein
VILLCPSRRMPVLTKSVAPEPVGLPPYSQEPATDPYPEPTGSTLPSPSQPH